MSEAALIPAPPAAQPLPDVTDAVRFGRELFDAAMRGEVALSDGIGCWEVLRHGHPMFGLERLGAAQRVAIDLTQHVARRPNAGLVRSCLAAVAMLEDVAEGAVQADLHAVLAQVSDLLDGALALVKQD